MTTPRQKGYPLFLLPCILLVSTLSCGKDSSRPEPEPAVPLVYGALVTPRVSLEADPLLVDGFQSLGADGYTVAHLAISWAQIEKGQGVRDWRTLDRFVRQARQRGMKLSVVVEFVHGGVVDLPAWRWSEFPGWDSPDLGFAMAGFLRELSVRSQGTIRYLWLGEGIDRYAAAHPDDEASLAAFVSMIGDSARVILPGSRIGTLVNPGSVDGMPRSSLIRSLRDSLGILGLWFDPALDLSGTTDPAAAMARVKEGTALWSDGPLAVLELGYPSSGRFGSSEAGQAEFASLLSRWLRGRPPEMELLCWSPLHDAGPAVADSLALRRYPADGVGRELFASFLSCDGLRRMDGSPKPGRQRFFEERP